MFDPYHKWLGIASEDQPPNHYRLLGVALFESDPEVIDAAANRQMAYLQQRATGQYAALSQKLLNEIAAARLCLLDPQKKAEYDAGLRQDQAGQRHGKGPPSPASRGDWLSDLMEDPPGTPPSVFKPPVRARRSIRFKSWHVVVALGGLVLLAITAWGLSRSGGKSEYAAKTPIPKAESQIAELQGKIKNWRASRDKLKVLLEQLKKDKATILQQLTELGISSQDDLGKNPKAQVLSQEAQDIVRQIAVDEKKFQEFDLAVLKCESQVRTISRQISAKEAGVSDLGFDELTRNMIALDESLAKEKDFTLPADFKDTLRDELTNYRQEQQKGAAPPLVPRSDTPPHPPTNSGGDGWISLFNGQTLDGWEADRNPHVWSVIGGAIVGRGRSSESSHLFHRAEFKDFRN